MDNILISSTLTTPKSSSNKLAVLFHGFSSGKNNATNTHLVPRLIRLGYNVIRFDFRGCGNSEGEIGDTTISKGLSDLDASLDLISTIRPDLFGKNLIFIGSSFGAAVALAASGKYKPKSIILKSPMLDIYGSQLKRRGEQGMIKWKLDNIVPIKSKKGNVQLKYDYVEDSFNYNFYDESFTSSGFSLSIIHGTNDEIAPIEFTDKFVEVSPSKINFKKMNNVNHRYDDGSNFQDMIEFIVGEVEEAEKVDG